eukprot:TRINITY_DN1432_c0_g2_i1.p1 TRINITY_DN1432_c0_g2~~TRINITY_DN1432_c0_g2_i1.p1  ORF type:complete len:413 (-),score=154.14 TRINITY_DN1432_c0_g2_i1:160-1398(-)
MPTKTKGTKRAAEVDELTVDLKAKGVKRAEYDALLEAVNHPLAGDLNADARKMLSAMILQALCVPATQRHQLQVTAIEMLSGVFATVVKSMQREIDTAAAELATKDASKAALDEKVSAAESSLKEASETSYSKKLACAEAAKAVLEAKAALAEAQKQRIQGDNSHEEAIRNKAELEEIFGKDFRLLRDGEAEEEAAQGHFENLQRVALTLSIDDSLVNAMPACMLKKPTARGSFDTMVVSQLEEGFTNKVAEITAKIENGAPAAAARKAAVDAAEQHLSAMKQAQSTAADAMRAAFDTEESQKGVAEVVKAELSAFLPEYGEAEAKKAAKVDQLENFREWNLANFEVLRDRQEALIFVPPPQKKAKKTEEPVTENDKDAAEVDEVAEANSTKTAVAEVDFEVTAQEAVVAGA